MKTTQSPAPATKSAATKPAAKKKSAAAPATKTLTPPAAPVAVAPAPIAVAVAPARVAAPAAPAPVAVSAPAPKPVTSKPAATTIAAQIDIGFGNMLYLRGEGPGLSWDVGLPMECVANDRWQITLPESSQPYTFKFLINDTTWSTGIDFTAPSGSSTTVTPTFN